MDIQKIIEHLEKSFENAEKLESKIDNDLKIDDDLTDKCSPGQSGGNSKYFIGSMTGLKTRHFYNNLLSKENSRYLEIGVWKGSSTCSAMCNNNASVVCIDNFSERFGTTSDSSYNVRNTFLSNFERYKGQNEASFIEGDCFNIDISQFKNKFNIYLYDGAHDEISQFRAIEYYLNVLDDIFVFIVDDWNLANARNGTLDSIEKNNLNILWKKEIRSENDTMKSHEDGVKNWWNGIVVFLLQKN